MSDDRKTLLFGWPLTILLTLAADYYTGPYTRFPVAFLFTIIPATWYNGPRWGVFYAVVAPLLQFGMVVYMIEPASPVLPATANMIVRIAVFLLVVFLLHRVHTQSLALAEKTEALSHLVSLCPLCKRVRDPAGEWERLESYFENWKRRSGDRPKGESANVLCPKCAETLKQTS